MTPAEILALLQVIARQQQTITALERALDEAQRTNPTDAAPVT